MTTTIYGYQENITGRINGFRQGLIKNYNGGCAWEIVVEIPDILQPYISVGGNICIEVKGYAFALNEILFAKDGEPAICYPDMDTGKNVYRKLKITKDCGWVSTAITI